MRILFLDIDGVLNSADWVHTRPHIACDLCERNACWFDPACVERINKVIATTDARIVVSSSWRVGRTVSELRAILRGHDVVAEIISATPGTFMLPSGAWSKRGNEIQAWLDDSRIDPRNITSFAIVDDDSDMAGLHSRFVQTSWASGIQDEHVEKLCQLLSE